MNVLKYQKIPKHKKDEINAEVVKQWERVRTAEISKAHDRVSFMVLLSTALVLNDKGIDIDEIKSTLKSIVSKADELTKYLTSNKCQYADGHKDYDVEYNRGFLEKLAHKYGIQYNEEMFEEEE